MPRSLPCAQATRVLALAISVLWLALLAQAGPARSATRLGLDRESAGDAAATLKLSSKTVRVGGTTLRYAVRNAGRVELQLGRAFTFERFNGGSWSAVPLGYAFPLIGYALDPGKTFRRTATLPATLEPGRYRLRKIVRYDGDKRLVLRAAFLVAARPAPAERRLGFDSARSGALAATLTVRPRLQPGTTRVRAVLRNVGRRALLYAHVVVLERREQGRWVNVSVGGFDYGEYFLRPRASYRELLTLPSALTAGRYRYVKDLGRFVLRAQFSVRARG